MELYRFRIFIITAIFFCSLSVPAYSIVEKAYWPEDIIVTEDDTEVIIVEKQSQRLYVMKNNNNQGFENILELKCSTGKKEGDKSLEGDAKTPEGIYHVTGHYPDKYLSAVYGSRAFTLDYPNFMDKKEGKNGHNIWIHGTDKEPLEDRTTNGCVALANNDIDKLKDRIKIGNTPVIIVKELKLTDKRKIQEKIGKRIESFFYQWLFSLKKGSYHDYLEFYSNDYLPEIEWWPRWIQIRDNTKKLNLEPENLNIFREDMNIYTIWFNLKIEVKGESVLLGLRKLFVKDSGHRLEIFGDLEPGDGEGLISSGLNLSNRVYLNENIKSFIENWAKAWSQKDMDSYSACYASNFKSDGMVKNQWIRYKKLLNRKYRYIKIGVKDLEIEKKGARVKARFFQTYESSGFSTSGTKTLVLKQEEGKWRIIKEIWKKAG